MYRYNKEILKIESPPIADVYRRLAYIKSLKLGYTSAPRGRLNWDPGTISRDDNGILIQMPFDSSFLFTCVKGIGRDFEITRGASLK